MKHRDRVQMALNHEEPDRCPMQISFTPEFAARLREEFGPAPPRGWMDKTKGSRYNPHGGGNTYELEILLDQDVLLTSVGWANSYYQDFIPGQKYTDEWGIGWEVIQYQTKYGNGIYTEMVEHPLADDSAVDSYKAPDPNRPDLYHESQKVLD